MSTARWLASLPLTVALATASPAHAEFHFRGAESLSACHAVSASEVAAAGAGAAGTLLLFVYTPSRDVELKVGAGYVFVQSALELYKTGRYAFAKCSQSPPELKPLAPDAPPSAKSNQGVVVMAPKSDLGAITSRADSAAASELPAKRKFFDDFNNLPTRKFLAGLNNLQTLAPAPATTGPKSDQPPFAPSSSPPDTSQAPAPGQNWSRPADRSPFGPGMIDQAALTGMVADAQTQAALDGAAVKIIGPTASDWRGAYARGGQFEFIGLPAGAYFIEATQEGYSPNGQWVNVIANGRANVLLNLARGSDCAFNVANDTPWRLEVSVVGYAYSPIEVGPFAGVVFPGNPNGATQIAAAAGFVDHPPLTWGPFTFACSGLQTVPLEPPPPEPATYPADAVAPPGSYAPPPYSSPDYGPPPGYVAPPG
jgi:hypothetical protein